MANNLVAVLAAYMPEFGRKSTPQAWVDYQEKLALDAGQHGGVVVDVAGDGWFVATFENALTAIRCATDIQRTPKGRGKDSAPTALARLHIGLNFEAPPTPGEIWPPGRDDTADRLVAMAEEGGLCLSRTLYDEVRSHIDLPFDTTRMPEHTAYLCEEIKHKYKSLNLLEAGAVRVPAAALQEPFARRRLAAVVAIDVAAYSRLMEVDEERALADLMAHRKATSRIGAKYGGRMVGTAGDGELWEFQSATGAVLSSVETQLLMMERNADLPDERKMHYRIGVNLCDVMVDGDDIFGDGVNVAARLEGIADAGGICIAHAVLEQVRDHISVHFEDMGELVVKNISRPIRVWRWLPTEVAPVADQTT